MEAVSTIEIISAAWPIFVAFVGGVFWLAKNQTKSQVKIETLEEKVKVLFEIVNKDK